MWFKVKEMVWPELVGAAAGWLIWWRTRIRGREFRRKRKLTIPPAVWWEQVWLSICYGIVHEHGGEIRAGNIAPHGAEVIVELPASLVSGRGQFAVKPRVLEEA